MPAELELPPDVLSAARGHAEAECPREACGLVVLVAGAQRYVPCRNLAEGQSHFVLHPEDYARADAW